MILLIHLFVRNISQLWSWRGEKKPIPLLLPSTEGTFLRRAKRMIVVGIGNSLDHYISSLWTLLGPILGNQFFPTYDPFSQLCLTYGAFAVAYLLKPMGAMFFTYLAQVRGAWAIFPYPLLGVGGGALLFSFFPDFFGFIGLWGVKAWCNFFISGETHLSRLLFLKEAEGNLVKEGSLFELSTLFGIMAATAVCLSLYFSPLHPGLWPLLFRVGGGIALFGAWLRWVAKKENNERRLPYTRYSIRQTIQDLCYARIRLFRLILMTGTSYAIYSFSCVFMTIIAPYLSHFSQKQALEDSLLLHVFDGVCLWGLVGLFLKKRAIQWMKLALYVLMGSFLILPIFLQAELDHFYRSVLLE